MKKRFSNFFIAGCVFLIFAGCSTISPLSMTTSSYPLQNGQGQFQKYDILGHGKGTVSFNRLFMIFDIGDELWIQDATQKAIKSLDGDNLINVTSHIKVTNYYLFTRVTLIVEGEVIKYSENGSTIIPKTSASREDNETGPTSVFFSYSGVKEKVEFVEHDMTLLEVGSTVWKKDFKEKIDGLSIKSDVSLVAVLDKVEVSYDGYFNPYSYYPYPDEDKLNSYGIGVSIDGGYDFASLLVAAVPGYSAFSAIHPNIGVGLSNKFLLPKEGGLKPLNIGYQFALGAKYISNSFNLYIGWQYLAQNFDKKIGYGDKGFNFNGIKLGLDF